MSTKGIEKQDTMIVLRAQIASVSIMFSLCDLGQSLNLAEPYLPHL